MIKPELRHTAIRDQQFAGVTYHIEGELVPVLRVSLGQAPIFFDHHILLWKSATTRIGTKAVRGLLKRAMGRMPILLCTATGPGEVAFSRDGAGQIIPIHLQPGQGIHTREHQYLAATGQVAYTITRARGIMNWVLGGNTLLIDHFRAEGGPGIVWLHGYGNVFEVTLAEGEAIDVEPGAWFYKDPSVTMTTITQNLSAGLLASAVSFFWNRLTGPGRVGLQSLYVPPSPGAI
ncbi:MAG: AIM24 family protein [Gammaproteobacteria bacterium]|nr:AIM24 family protein [Gammaproteobacteria bacterium]